MTTNTHLSSWNIVYKQLTHLNYRPLSPLIDKPDNSCNRIRKPVQLLVINKGNKNYHQTDYFKQKWHQMEITIKRFYGRCQNTGWNFCITFLDFLLYNIGQYVSNMLLTAANRILHKTWQKLTKNREKYRKNTKRNKYRNKCITSIFITALCNSANVTRKCDLILADEADIFTTFY